jgi:hypothetical protein
VRIDQRLGSAGQRSSRVIADRVPSASSGSEPVRRRR